MWSILLAHNLTPHQHVEEGGFEHKHHLASEALHEHLPQKKSGPLHTHHLGSDLESIPEIKIKLTHPFLFAVKNSQPDFLHFVEQLKKQKAKLTHQTFQAYFTAPKQMRAPPIS